MRIKKLKRLIAKLKDTDDLQCWWLDIDISEWRIVRDFGTKKERIIRKWKGRILP